MSETRSPIHITLPTHAALQSPIEVNTPASRSTIPPPPYVAFADPPPPSGAQSAPPEVPVTEVEASSGPLLQPPLPAHNVQDTIQPQPTIVSTQDRRTAFEQTGRPSPQIQTAQPGSIYWPPRADPPTLTLGQSYREKRTTRLFATFLLLFPRLAPHYSMLTQQTGGDPNQPQQATMSPYAEASTTGQQLPPQYGDSVGPTPYIVAPAQIPYTAPQTHEGSYISPSWDSKSPPINTSYTAPPIVQQHSTGQQSQCSSEYMRVPTVPTPQETEDDFPRTQPTGISLHPMAPIAPSPLPPSYSGAVDPIIQYPAPLASPKVPDITSSASEWGWDSNMPSVHYADPSSPVSPHHTGTQRRIIIPMTPDAPIKTPGQTYQEECMSFFN
ncbi:hypothetical protein D9619_012612 [Psilocybe cf. subviscida]|uniref:Uncharacterized protein n=1 Tax=Psilocybe cf. subviscida TaxID=2480587 RepID=A0A8H5B769_9AGAR|nr:hypothetical protein D9619_012612 [Psilocybe cf. subviscida]